MVGFNIYYMGCNNETYSELNERVAGAVRRAHINTIRVWFLQGCGGSPRSWASYDAVVEIARRNGVYLVVTLANQWGECGSELSFDWFELAYRSARGRCSLSYRDYVAAVARRYADEPAVALWQLVNEAQAGPSAGPCDQAAAGIALRAFSDDMVTVIHRVDHHHLVNLGTIGNDGCGLGDEVPGRPYSDNYQFIHAGLLDMCEVHDTGGAEDAMSAVLRYRVEQCHRLGKPVFTGEAGVSSILLPHLQERAQAIAAKLRSQLRDEVGLLVWHGCSHAGLTPLPQWEICPGDPTESVLAAAADQWAGIARPWLSARPWSSGEGLTRPPVGPPAEEESPALAGSRTLQRSK